MRRSTLLGFVRDGKGARGRPKLRERGGRVTATSNAATASLRVVTWNVARRSSRLVEQATALALREPDVVALQEVTRRTAALWRSAFEMMGLPHVRASLDDADPARAPAARRTTGVMLASRTPLRGLEALAGPWPETALCAATESIRGQVELHCVHVPNAANGWVKVESLHAIRRGLAVAAPAARVLCGDLNTPRRESPDGEVLRSRATHAGACAPTADRPGTRLSSTSFQACESSATATLIALCTGTARGSRAGPGGRSPDTVGAGASITSSPPRNCVRSPVAITMRGATRG